MTGPRRHSFLGLALVAAILVLPLQLRAQDAPRQIPGLTAEDAYPNGCVDCHVNDEGTAVRFSVLLSEWLAEVAPDLMERAVASSPARAELEGVHPEVEADDLQDIPGSCIDCHKRRRREAPEMGRLMHLTHLVGGADNTFLTEYGGQCTHCHKLDAETGEWANPSGPEQSGGGG